MGFMSDPRLCAPSGTRTSPPPFTFIFLLVIFTPCIHKRFSNYHIRGIFCFMSEFSEETLGGDGYQKRHYIRDRITGREIDLTQAGEVHGYVAGQRIRFTDACYEILRGQEATILGFSADDRTWTQLDGFDGALSTLNEFVPVHFEPVI